MQHWYSWTVGPNHTEQCGNLFVVDRELAPSESAAVSLLRGQPCNSRCTWLARIEHIYHKPTLLK